MSRLDRVLRLFDEPWAITPPMLQTLRGIVDRRLAGEALSEDELAAVAHPPKTARTQGAVAVIPIFGVLANRMNLMTDVSGGTSVEQLRGHILQAEADPNISAMAFDVDSPGGGVGGIFELSETIRGLSTPTVAVVDDLGASAAYALASAADEIVATPSAMVGSIGVEAQHTESSDADEKLGVRTTLITAGEGKADGNPFQPLSDRARDDIQAKVDHFQAMFVDAVVKGRNAAGQHLQGSTVRTKWKAKVYTAADALEIGMIDRIGSMEDTLGRLVKGRKATTRAAVDTPEDADRRRKARRLMAGV